MKSAETNALNRHPIEKSWEHYGQFVDSSAVDLTARKEVERQLLDSEQRCRVILEVIESVNVTTDLDELLKFIHQSLNQILISLAIERKPIKGVVEIPSLAGAEFKKTHVATMQMGAGLSAMAIENIRLSKLLQDTENQLRQSQKMEAIGQLAGGVAHDFNNLLTAITGYSEISLRRLEPSPAVRKNLEQIQKASTRAASLTRQLLAFSRKQVLQAKVFDLNSVVTEMDKMLRRLIGENVDLKSTLDPALGCVNADPGQIEQVLMNLVVNARDSLTADGEITIETANVYLDCIDGNGQSEARPYVMLAVTDTGAGMDAATQSRIFDPFFTTKEVGKGTGLGLSTVSGVVEQSGGRIEVSSELGKGSRFMVYLPTVVPGEARLPENTPTTSYLGNETILVAEDEAMVRGMARQILELSGYEVLEAASGREAVEVCAAHQGPIHLLLTDVVMPQMSGPRLREEITKIRSDIKVLFMSGYTDNSIVDQCALKEGMPFLQKPFSPDALAAKVRGVLDSEEKGTLSNENLRRTGPVSV